jgi:hypothetical protein
LTASASAKGDSVERRAHPAGGVSENPPKLVPWPEFRSGWAGFAACRATVRVWFHEDPGTYCCSTHSAAVSEDPGTYLSQDSRPEGLLLRVWFPEDPGTYSARLSRGTGWTVPGSTRPGIRAKSSARTNMCSPSPWCSRRSPAGRICPTTATERGSNPWSSRSTRRPPGRGRNQEPRSSAPRRSWLRIH